MTGINKLRRQQRDKQTTDKTTSYSIYCMTYVQHNTADTDGTYKTLKSLTSGASIPPPR